MARQYAPRSVLRQLPLELVTTFLGVQGIHVGPEWDALVDGDTAALYRAWTNMPPADRERVELMLRRVHEMASETGVRALVAEAGVRGHHIADPIAAIDGHHAKALWALINHAPAFHTAHQLLGAASPIGRFWNLTPGFGGRPYDASREAVQQLRLSVAALYREQGRGQLSTVEQYERDGSLYLFLYLDDYTQTHTAHDPRGTLVRAPVRPVLEVVYVYSPAAGTLDQFARGDRRWQTALRDRFCEHVLRCLAPPAAPGRRAYRLGGLLDRGFSLPTDPARGVHAATVRRLRVLSVRDFSRRVTLEANPARAGDVYDMLDAHFPADRFPRGELLVNQATFVVRHVLPGEDRERSLTFDVSFPDACNLGSLLPDQRAVGEWCLRRWGILDDDDAGGGYEPGVEGPPAGGGVGRPDPG